MPCPTWPPSDPEAGTRAFTDLIPTAIAEAEAFGAAEVAGHLRLALLAAQRRAVEADE